MTKDHDERFCVHAASTYHMHLLHVMHSMTWHIPASLHAFSHLHDPAHKFSMCWLSMYNGNYHGESAPYCMGTNTLLVQIILGVPLLWQHMILSCCNTSALFAHIFHFWMLWIVQYINYWLFWFQLSFRIMDFSFLLSCNCLG